MNLGSDIFAWLSCCDFYPNRLLLVSGSQLQAQRPSLEPLLGQSFRPDWAVVVMCTQGSLDLCVGYRQFCCPSGHFVITLPHQIVQLNRLSPDFDGLVMAFASPFLQSLNIGSALQPYISVRRQPLIKAVPGIEEPFTNLYNMMRGLLRVPDHPHRDHVMHLLLEAYFFGMYYYLQGDPHQLTTAEFHTDSFLQLVEQQACRHHDVDYYASQLSLSKKRLTACVSQTTGRTASDWIDSHLFLEAKWQLQSTQKSVKQIAALLNFSTPSSFGAWFKHHSGITPAAFRQQEQ